MSDALRKNSDYTTRNMLSSTVKRSLLLTLSQYFVEICSEHVASRRIEIVDRELPALIYRREVV